VVPIPKGELRVINTDPYNQREKGFIHVPTPQGEIVMPRVLEYVKIESQRESATYIGEKNTRIYAKPK